jgi:ATP synthase protein I
MDKVLAGRYAFIVGLVISVIVGLVNVAGFVVVGDILLGLLIILGIIVGFLNITGTEAGKFLMGTVALLLVGAALSTVLSTFPLVLPILQAFTSFVAGAALIIALKEVYIISKTQ